MESDLRYRAQKKFDTDGDETEQRNVSAEAASSYRPVQSDPRRRNDPAFLPAQFQDSSKRSGGSDTAPCIPWNSVLLGLLLFICGFVALLTLASDVMRGYEDEVVVETTEDVTAEKTQPFRRSERFYPLLFLGLVAIIPGAYVSFFCLMAFLGVDGYSYDDIP